MNEYHGMSSNKITTSKINTYIMCQAKHYFCYIEKIKAPSRSALLKGIAFHSAVETNYAQKIETEKDLPVSDVLDVFGSQFDAGVPDTQFFEDEKIGEIKDSGYGLLKAYQGVIAPKVQPAQVEMLFELKLVDSDEVFSGRIDLITNENIIRDQKTKKARPSAIENDHHLAMTGYSIGYLVEHQEKPKGVMIDYIVDKKTPECISYEDVIEDSDVELLLSLIGRYQHAIKLGLDMPNRGHFLCNRRYCSYADLCEQRYGGKIRGEK